ncbi:MAG: hypothetical protein MZW92_50795 [Comamonadaceae bacterium]|nr:hypothetical protein [Comamonadaceae bacterium]
MQQNAPAWTLLAMFFLAVPLSVTFIKERAQGSLSRLQSMPVPGWVLLGSKVAPYLVINQIQLVLILAVGVWGLPLLGGDRLTLGDAPGGIALLGVSASLAAIGFALLDRHGGAHARAGDHRGRDRDPDPGRDRRDHGAETGHAAGHAAGSPSCRRSRGAWRASSTCSYAAAACARSCPKPVSCWRSGRRVLSPPCCTSAGSCAMPERTGKAPVARNCHCTKIPPCPAVPTTPPSNSRLKTLIVAACNRETAPESIGDDDSLIGSDSVLGLDSLEVLQVNVAIGQQYRVRIDDSKHARRVMKSINTLADFLRPGD